MKISSHQYNSLTTQHSRTDSESQTYLKTKQKLQLNLGGKEKIKGRVQKVEKFCYLTQSIFVAIVISYS